MIKKLLPILLFIVGVIAVIGGGTYFYKRTYIDASWIPIKASTPQETFNTFLIAAHAHDERAIKKISATNEELDETKLFGAFSKCIETRSDNENTEEEYRNDIHAEKEPRVVSEFDKAPTKESSYKSYDLFEDETVPVGVSGLVLNLNALNISPNQIKVTDSQILQDEAVLTFFITDKYGSMTGAFKQQALFKKLGDEWKMFYTLSEKSEFEGLNFAVQKSDCE